MSEWRDIGTAPKDGTRVLLRCGHVTTVGWWELQRYNKQPKPYWTTEYGWLAGVSWDRSHQPDYWQPLPEPPRG